MSAQSWVAPTITSENPVSGTNYKVYNVGSGKYLQEGKAWFSWSTTAILADNGRDFTFTGDASSFTFTNKDRSGNNKVFTSGNNIVGDAMHVDGANATNYGLTQMPNGYYHIHDAGGDASSACWGYNSSFHATGVVAHADANAEGWNCEWAFLTDASFTFFNARVKLYNELLKAYSEGVNTDDAGSVYNNTSSTLEAVNSAYNTLHQDRYEHQLAIASNSNPRDITEWVLTNPDFSTGNINGWETNYVSGQQATNIGYQNNNAYTNGSIVISQFIEAWHSGNRVIGDGYLRQTVSGLPEGKYLLDCDAIAVNQGNASATTTGALLFITADGSDYTASLSTGNGVPQHFSTQFLFTGEGDVIFGLKTVSTTANWIAADNFKVTFYGIDLSAYETQLATEVATFNGYESSIDATVYATLKSMVDDQNKAYTSSKTYAAAIANMQAINAYAAALVAANAVDQNAKMNATVLSALQTEIGNATSVTLAGIADATTALTTATANATASIANYAEAKTILDAANIYDAAGQTSYAANETIAAIQAAYDEGTLTAVSTEQKNAAKTALATACKAQTQPADGCDMSPWIVNPNFDGSIDGWTIEKRGNGWTGNPYKDGTIEYWTGSTTDQNASGNFFDFYQTRTSLPSGAYTLSADLMNSTNGEEGASWNGGGNAGLYGMTASDEKRVLVTTDGATNNQVLANYTTEEILVIDGELRLGVKNINPLTGRWFVADNFKLTYARQLTAEEEEAIAKANALVAYTEALAAAQAIEDGDIPVPAYENLQGVITDNTLADGTSTEYNDAATALNEAATTAEAMVAPYAAWKTLKDQANALAAVSNNDNTANGTLRDAITAKSTDAEGATAAGTITTATSTLKAAMVTYVKTAEPINDKCFDLTFMILNPHFTEGTATNPTGWTASWPDNPSGEWGGAHELRIATHNFEAYHKVFELSQTIADLPKGTYKVTLQGFARHDGDDKDKTNLFCGIVNQPIKNIKDEYSTTPIASGKPAMGDINGESSYTLGEQTVYQPNGMSGSYYFFQETNPATGKLFYTNEVQTLITQPADLKIGFKCETWSDWVIWDNFHLYYYGSAIAVTIDENEASSSYTEDIENANVTLKRTFTTDKSNWNTISLPFDLNNNNLKEAFGDDVAVAEYSEEAVGENSTVNFTMMETPAISANVPVLLKTSTDKTIFIFNGVTIKAGEAKVEGTNFDFVGTYAASTTIAEGDYFIASNKLYKSSGATTIKGTRAYIKAKDPEAGARIADFWIEGGETTGISRIENSELRIENSVYNLQGQRVNKAQKGLYIQNGKKVIVK